MVGSALPAPVRLLRPPATLPRPSETVSDLHVLANPNARGGRGARLVEPLLQALSEAGWSAPSHALTEAPGHARELVRAFARPSDDPSGDPGGPRILVVMGGDGTLHEAVNGLRDAGFPPSVTLAVFPVGTGNDFHRMLRARAGVDGLLEALARGRPRRLDVGLARWEGGDSAFVNLLGVGIDVAVLQRRARFQRLPGLLQYGAALLSALRGFQPVPLEVEARFAPDLPGAGPGKSGPPVLPSRTPALLAAITVGPSIGGGFLLSPEARPDDAALDLFLAQPLSFLEVMRHLPGVVRGTLGTTDRIHRARLTSARLASGDGTPFFFELDGEPFPDPTPWLEIEVLPGALSLLDLPLPGEGPHVSPGPEEGEPRPTARTEGDPPAEGGPLPRSHSPA